MRRCLPRSSPPASRESTAASGTARPATTCQSGRRSPARPAVRTRGLRRGTSWRPRTQARDGDARDPRPLVRAGSGRLRRNDARWDVMVRDLPSHRRGQSGLYYLLHADGYVAYRATLDWNDWDPRNTCTIAEYATVTPEAHSGAVAGAARPGPVRLDRDQHAAASTTRSRCCSPSRARCAPGRSPTGSGCAPGRARAAGRAPYALEIEVVWRGPRRADRSAGGSCFAADRTARPVSGPTVRRTLAARSRPSGRCIWVGSGCSPSPGPGRSAWTTLALAQRLDRALLADRAPFHGTPF